MAWGLLFCIEAESQRVLFSIRAGWISFLEAYFSVLEQRSPVIFYHRPLDPLRTLILGLLEAFRCEYFNHIEINIIVTVGTSKAIVMGSLQEHKCLAVTILLISSTFQCSPVGLLALSISFRNDFSPRYTKQHCCEIWKKKFECCRELNLDINIDVSLPSNSVSWSDLIRFDLIWSVVFVMVLKVQ